MPSGIRGEHGDFWIGIHYWGKDLSLHLLSKFFPGAHLIDENFVCPLHDIGDCCRLLLGNYSRFCWAATITHSFEFYGFRYRLQKQNYTKKSLNYKLFYLLRSAQTITELMPIAVSTTMIHSRISLPISVQ